LDIEALWICIYVRLKKFNKNLYEVPVACRLLNLHEHLFVFRKPGEGEKVKKFKESMA
jgi:hypothetical protein